jgi:hypothetical protein
MRRRRLSEVCIELCSSLEGGGARHSGGSGRRKEGSRHCCSRTNPGEEGADRGGGSRRVDDARRRRTAELTREEVAWGRWIRRLEAEVGSAQWGWPATEVGGRSEQLDGGPWWLDREEQDRARVRERRLLISC